MLLVTLKVLSKLLDFPNPNASTVGSAMALEITSVTVREGAAFSALENFYRDVVGNAQILWAL
jgi:hypothetical protein